MANYRYSISIQPHTDTTPENITTSTFPTDVFRINLMFSRTSDLHNWPYTRTEPFGAWTRRYVYPRQDLLSEQLGPAIVSRILAPTGPSSQDIESITSPFMSLARETETEAINSDEEIESFAYNFMSLERARETDPIDSDATVLTIDVFVLISTTYSEDQREREEPSMQSVRRSTPASKEAIQKLKKVRTEDCLELMRECTVCSEEFQFDLQNLRLPCGHVYHKDCIVKWLEISHMCPLCRYQLPCSEN